MEWLQQLSKECGILGAITAATWGIVIPWLLGQLQKSDAKREAEVNRLGQKLEESHLKSQTIQEKAATAIEGKNREIRDLLEDWRDSSSGSGGGIATDRGLTNTGSRGTRSSPRKPRRPNGGSSN